jgi:hypothetical protein
LFAEETHADIVLPQFYFVHHPGNENHFNIWILFLRLFRN